VWAVIGRENLSRSSSTRDAHDLRVRDAYGVERDVDVARLVDHRPEVPVDGVLVERVDRRRLGRATGGDDLLGERLDRGQQAPRQEEPGPFAREGAGHRGADRAAGAVDHRNFVVQHHLGLLSMMQTPPPRQTGRRGDRPVCAGTGV